MIDKPFACCWFYGWKDYVDKPSRVLCTMRNWYENLRYFIKWIKWFFQRGSRGFADCDWWDMHSYLVHIIVPMLKEIKEKGIGYPGYGEASTPEQWNASLDEMIEAFEAAGRVIDDEYYKEVSGDSVEAINNASRKEVRKWFKLSKADQKLFQKKIKIFTKYFFSLWD